MIIDRGIMTEIIAHAEKEAPVEACGYLAGAGGRITRHYRLMNAEGREDHYTADPVEQFAVYKAVRREGLQIIGAYHSHPVTPARPSAEDIRLAQDPHLLYVIVSLAGGQRTVKGFWIKGGEVEEELLTVEEKEQ